MRQVRVLTTLVLTAPLALAVACGGEAPSPSTPCPSVPPAAPSAAPVVTAPATGPATPDEARVFMTKVDKDLRRLWVARDRAGWVNQNFITDDTEALASAGEEATAEYITRAVDEEHRFDGVQMDTDLARQFYLLKLAQTVPAPRDEARRKELADIEASLQAMYGKGKYCPPRLNGKCETLDDLSKTLKKSRNYDELTEAWSGWHSIAPPMKAKFARYVELGNEGAKDMGFADMGALWRAGYDMTPEQFEADIERLWQQVKPLYDELHCYVRSRLQKKYGKDKVPDHAPIPAQLLGNMWAQEWNNIYDVVEPFAGQGSLDVDKSLKDKKYDPVKMTKTAESFFTSLGLDPLPQSFWERSLLARPKDRDVVCHASAWDVTWSNDLRIKACIDPTEEDLITLHHELGHDYYFHSYFKLPVLFQNGANDGFHEAIGDTLALSVTPDYLKKIGLLDNVPNNPKAEINQQLKMALDKVAFLPFGLLIDKWRWDVLSGKTSPSQYNAAWWALKKQYQGVSAPVSRSESDFDPGAKYHVPASVPYIRYFLARIYQFQFHRALCKAAGQTGPLSKCSIYGNKDAGAKLRAMLELGASKPWPEAMRAISGETQADASAMLEYFAPLKKWLDDETKGQTCGW